MKNFFCFKVEDKKDGQPDYQLSAKIGGAFVSIGGGWIKEGKKGKFISFQLSKEFQGKPGWKLVEDKYPTKEGEGLGVDEF